MLDAKVDPVAIAVRDPRATKNDQWKEAFIQSFEDLRADPVPAWVRRGTRDLRFSRSSEAEVLPLLLTSVTG